MDGNAVLDLDRSADAARADLARPGDHWRGDARLAAWNEVRDAATDDLDRRRRAAISPEAVEDRHPGRGPLPAAAVEVVHRIASDPGRLTEAWARSSIAELGEEAYTELVAVAAMATVIDTFDLVRGRPLQPLPEPATGEPKRERPDGVGDVGAWVAQSTAKQLANVSRAVSLVPVTEGTWRALVTAFYSRGGEFLDLVWGRPLSRPQVELVAARTTALNECFY